MRHFPTNQTESEMKEILSILDSLSLSRSLELQQCLRMKLQRAGLLVEAETEIHRTTSFEEEEEEEEDMKEKEKEREKEMGIS